MAEAAVSGAAAGAARQHKDPSTWSDYATALAAVQAGHADGISYMLTEADPFAAIDLDHCRHPRTHSIDMWAQNFMQSAATTYRR